MNKRGQLEKSDWKKYPKFGVDTSVMSNAERHKLNGGGKKVKPPTKKK